VNFDGVADTHAAIWFLFADPRISARAKAFIERAASASRSIAISPITLVEIAYLVEKSKLPSEVYYELTKALADPGHVLKEAPFTAEVAEALRRVPRDAVPDMPDRIVAATAVFLGVPVISRDGRIRASTVETIW
jgi:PIN domain nuclease of toxin-antitoxin system